MSKCIASTLLFLAATTASAGQLPEIGSVGVKLQDLQGGLKKSMSFDPVLAANPNRGSFSTEIQIELPPSVSGLAALALQYNSQRPENRGLGVGWAWNLPTI